jgi:hypothetical protein
MCRAPYPCMKSINHFESSQRGEGRYIETLQIIPDNYFVLYHI